MKKYTLEKRMRSSFIIVFTFIFLVILMIMAGMIRRLYWEKSYRMCEQLVSLNLNLLNRQIMDIQRSQDVVVKNAQVRAAAAYYKERTERDYLEELKFQRRLDEVFYDLERGEEIRNAFIVNTEGECVYAYIRSLKVGFDMREVPWFSQLTQEIRMNTCYISGVHDRSYLVTDDQGECISMVVPIQENAGYTFEPQGYLVCDVDLDNILYGSGEDGEMQFALMDGGGHLYSKEKLEDEGWLEKKINGESDKEENRVYLMKNGLFQEKIMVSMKSKLYGWRVIGIKNLTEIVAMDKTMLVLFGIAFLTAVAMIVVLSRRIARSILNPMNRLIEACNQVAEGDYTVEFPDAPSQEVSILSETVASMVKNVGQLTEQVLEEEKAVAEEKLKALQHQINPHFLNNVLQAVKAMALEGETEKISRMVTLLGKFLSYSVYQPYENVQLEEELKHLRTYIEIQNIRYQDAVLFSIDCEPELKEVLIPKLTLQPIVENAIEHGFQGKGMLLLDISAELDKETAQICVHDNGKGIGEMELAGLRRALKQGETCQTGSGIGIINVNARLKKRYGAEYGVELNSREGSGTTVVLRIPSGEVEG